MTRNEYLKSLVAALKNNGINDVADIVAKYDKRFDLAKEAGFSEEEAIAKFGTPEEVAKTYVKKPIEPENASEKDQGDNALLNCEFNLVSDDIDLSYKEGLSEPEVDFNDANPDYYEITKTPNYFELVLKPKAQDFLNSLKHSHLKVMLPVGRTIGDIKIEVVSSKVTVSKLIAKSIKFSGVSGRIEADDLRADSMNLTIVSGGLNVKNLTADTVRLSMVSGNSDFGCAEIKTLRANSISGNVTIHSGHVDVSSISSITGKIINISEKK
jgi:hypothetical protein